MHACAASYENIFENYKRWVTGRCVTQLHVKRWPAGVEIIVLATREWIIGDVCWTMWYVTYMSLSKLRTAKANYKSCCWPLQINATSIDSSKEIFISMEIRLDWSWLIYVRPCWWFHLNLHRRKQVLEFRWHYTCPQVVPIHGNTI